MSALVDPSGVAGAEDLRRSSASPTMEWLEADGRGGYASGTLSGVPLRRYHGLLIVARYPPHERVMLVNQLHEVLELGGQPVVLWGGRSPIESGWGHCTAFSWWPLPTWTYSLGGVVLERSIARPQGTSHAVVRWRCISSPGPLRLRLRPMLTGRKDHDAQTRTSSIDDRARPDGRGVSWKPHGDFPRVHARGHDSYRHQPTWIEGIDYPIDRERGEVSREDWWSPGELTLNLLPGESRTIVLSPDDISNLDGHATFIGEVARRLAAKPAPSGSRLVDVLRLSAESYTVDFVAGATSMAGFPWFDAWTRDTFTSFGGLYLATGNFAGARRVLATFAPLVRCGMLPANLPALHTEPRWNAADASLWFVISVSRYVRYTEDVAVLDDFAMKAVRAIVDGYSAGEPPHIRVDGDGLVDASAPDQALTWMDADYEGHVMTPRRGKPVEIQALWVHALGLAAKMAVLAGDHDFAARCRERRRRAIASFRSRFWNARTGHLFDVIDGPDGDDATLRPNQIFAIALDDDLLPRDQAMAVLDVVDARLRTPFGLRTLASDDPNYHPHYVGDQSQRDPAYHQGTVWPFLLGPFLSAWVRLHERTELARREALGFLDALEASIDGLGCVGHLAEIFDAEPPHAPRGCFAQAWSAGELLFSIHEHLLPGAHRALAASDASR